jgi:hypothetical protein
MYSRNPLFGQVFFTRNNFEGLPAGYNMGQAVPAPASVVVTPPPVVVAPSGPSIAASVGTVALLGGAVFLGLELTGVTKVTGIRKYLK